MNHASYGENFHKRLKVSAFEDKKPPKDVKTYIEELIKYEAKVLRFKECSKWEPPKFPVKGGLLKENGFPGRKIILDIMVKLKDKRIDTDSNIIAYDLLRMTPDILGEISRRRSNN
ncbi:hypothetical protein QYM36_016777 [Artemia franciscana]|uniref:Uncharacterized protein n=1 Tax=Artemia franciscana TaxID=6661 RepID=A0AA88H913_ARTSF|nr:hypothetical protein QYM36_016777 [Artemia franciscana]